MKSPKIIIENQNALGQTAEQVELDTNRVDVHSETTSRIANLVAISSRGVWIDVTSWIVYCAAAFSVADLALDMGAADWAVYLLLGIPLLTLFWLIATAMERRTTLIPHGLFRLLLLSIGAAIASL
ncbi:hypothetical protein [cf. Phormidesmis sp. LEGE 11477]|uniref:hypothetical protein n=1 Tax=cf. Phormidesmis sp. LEGE 11477 TaxID=1828680 RepID=UPI00187FD70F|nr:hypothetical protein [cf. Phormidesmis sp. LEGE 11477]MBE9063296.1 hypothetical protein [cf. Phormidesmis sp. LEGE 11477]